MKCSDIFEYLKGLYPLELSMDWDNSGFLLGRLDRDVKNILVVLDITDKAIEYAVQNKIGLIVSHHPMIFSAVKSITDRDLLGRRILKILENKICVIAMHTNFDIANGGMADLAADRLHLKNAAPLEVTYIDGCELGIGKVGELADALSFDGLVSLLKSAFNLKHVTVFGRENAGDNIKTVAISPGSGKGMAGYAAGRAKVLITGDITHHEGLDASGKGLCVIDATHYGLEHIFIDEMADRLGELKDLSIFKFTQTDPAEVM